MSAQINVAANNMISNSFVTFNGETKNLRNVVKSFKHTLTSYDEIAAFLKSVNKENGIACEYYDDDTVIHPFIDLDISEQPTINDLRRACNCISELFGLLEESMNTTGNTYICGRIREDIPTRLNNIICSMFKDIVPKYDHSDFKNIYTPKCNKYISMHIVFPFAACKLSKFRTFMQSYLAYKNIPFIDVSVYGNGRIFRCGNTCKYDADGHKIPNTQLFSPYNLDAEHNIYEYYSMITCFIPTAEFDCAVDNKYIIQPPEAKVIVKTIQDKPTQIKPDASILDTIKQAIPNNANLDKYDDRFKLMSCLHSITNEEEWNEIRDMVNENRVHQMTNSYNYNWMKLDYPVHYAWKLLGLPRDQLPDQFIELDNIETFYDAVRNGKIYNMVNKKYQEWLEQCRLASIELDEYKVRQFLNLTIAEYADKCIKYQAGERKFYIYGFNRSDRREMNTEVFKKYLCTDMGDHGKFIFTFGDKKVKTDIPTAIMSEGPVYHWTKNKAKADEKHVLSLFREPRKPADLNVATKWLDLMKKCVIEDGEEIDDKRKQLSIKQWDMLVKTFAWHIQTDFQYVEKLMFLYDTCNGGSGKSMFLEGMSYIYGDLAMIMPPNIANETDRTVMGGLFRFSPELNDGLGKSESSAYHMVLKETAARQVRTRIMNVGNRTIANQGLTAIASNYPNPNDILNEPGMPRRLMHARFHREADSVYAEIANCMTDPEILGQQLYWLLHNMDIGDFNPNKLKEYDLPNEEIVDSTLMPYKLFRRIGALKFYPLVDDSLITYNCHILHKKHKTMKAYDYVMDFELIHTQYRFYCEAEKISAKDMMPKEDLFNQFRNTLVSKLCYAEVLDKDIRGIKPGDCNTRTSYKQGMRVVYFNAAEMKNMLGYTDADIISAYREAVDADNL